MIINTAHAGESKKAPVFTYSGQYRLTDQGGGNWLLELLTSGTLVFQKLNSFKDVDVCCVGGGGCGGRWAGNGYGGGGGAGGDVENAYGIRLEENKEYTVTIGEGGQYTMTGLNGEGGDTEITGILTARGGKPGGSGADGGKGADGASGGGSASQFKGAAGNGGTDGSDGENGFFAGGKGSGKTTRPFEDPAMEPLAAGGGGASYNDGGTAGQGGETGGGNGGKGWGGSPGAPNTGSGGGGSGGNAAGEALYAPGGTGAAFMRNKRRKAA